MGTTAMPSPEEATSEDLAERLFTATLGTVDILAVYLGDRLGWYRSLARDGPATPRDLAGRTGTHPRYAREWLEQQAVTGLLRVEDPSAGNGDDRVFSIPAATAEVLTDERSLAYLAPLARMFGGVAPHLPDLLTAYRSGGGVSWDRMGTDARESQADMNRPWFERELAGALAGVDTVHRALQQPGAAILDVGCGGGWSTIALARAYPDASLHGIDVDGPSIDLARENARAAEVGDRVQFTHQDASELPEGAYTAAFAFECIHDMPRPVEVLSSVRRSLAPDGFMVVMDEAVADEFAADGDDTERLMYGFSLFVCLPDGMSSTPSAGTGTVMRADTFRRYAGEAGFEDAQVLPIEDFGFWRFYLLR